MWQEEVLPVSRGRSHMCSLHCRAGCSAVQGHGWTGVRLSRRGVAVSVAELPRAGAWGAAGEARHAVPPPPRLAQLVPALLVLHSRARAHTPPLPCCHPPSPRRYDK